MLAQKFEEQVKKNPLNIAVKTGGTSWTYEQLNREANRTARAVEAHKKNNEDYKIVGLYLGHTPGMLAAVLGTLKAGAVYVPLSPGYPLKRLLYMVEHAGVDLIISASAYREEAGQLAAQSGAALVLMDELDTAKKVPGTFSDETDTVKKVPGTFSDETDTVKKVPGTFSDELDTAKKVPGTFSDELDIAKKVPGTFPAYIMYTSGSTGTPKGVAQTHENVFHFIRNWTREFQVTSNDRLTLFSSFSHDASVMDIFAALLNGACLYPYDVRRRDHTVDITGLLQKEKITHFHSVPSFYNFFASTLENNPEFPHLRYIILGGEAFRGHEILLLKKHFPGSTLVNLYGQTETSFNSAWKVRADDATGHILLGQPLENTGLFVVDPDGEEVDPLQTGEIVVASPHVSPGYWKEEGLTARVFADDPAWGRLYWTGDMGRLLPDGSIEFMGRKDRQVKIRGFRVETGEIESCLLKLEQVNEAAVTVRETKKGGPVLRAFITSDAEPNVTALREHLEPELPDYMIPADFVRLQAMPLTATGKIDRQRLSTLDAEPLKTATPRLAPGTGTEQTVAAAWKEALGRDDIGINDTLFDTGGNSFDMIRINNILSRALDRDIPIVKQFEFPTIREFARYLDSGGIDPVSETNAAEDSRTALDGGSDIAVIGMAGRFPGAANIENFWDNLKKGVESITFFEPQELIDTGLDADLTEDANYVPAKGVLENCDHFDAAFFNFQSYEAEAMDPQLRVFHEVLWEAFEHAGYNPFETKSPIGLYAGSAPNHFWLAHSYIDSEENPLGDMQRAILSNHFSNRAAYTLNLKGPVITLNTACSTSLAAVHLACRGLLEDECRMAAAGGVSIMLPVKSGYLYQEGMIFSRDGHVRAFDADASGTLFSDGAGVVILKRLDHALEDNDFIHALVKGTAMTNDGNRKAGYTAPGIDGQAAVIRSALESAGAEPGSIGFIEAHGTGTALGDPVEITALNKIFAGNPKESCAVGSVKNNVGHLNIAAGIAGFIKAVLALKHRVVPPVINFSKPNPALQLEQTPFFINTRAIPWPQNSKTGLPCRAGVSSFGLGGANAHVVLEEYIMPERETQETLQILPISAATPTALEQLSHNLAEHLDRNRGLDIGDVAYTLQAGRKHHGFRRVVVSGSTAGAVDHLNAEPGGPGVIEAQNLERPLVFMFPGQGSQYIGMARDLYNALPEFRRHMDRCFRILNPLLAPELDTDVKDFLYPRDLSIQGNRMHASHKKINQTNIAQPLIFSVQYALARQLMAWGFQPAAVTGHSIGQYAAACLAGIFSLEDAIETVVTRGNLMASMPPGLMLGIPLPSQEIEPMLSGSVSLAAVNSPSRCVVSGTIADITALKEKLDAMGHRCTLLHTSHAYHSASMDPVLEPMEEYLRGIALKPPRIPCISNLDGQWLTAGAAQSPAYWASHIREAVQFSAGIDTITQNGDVLFIEVGPGNTLSTFVRQRENGLTAFDTMRHPRETVCDHRFLLNKIGTMWQHGVPVDWRTFNRSNIKSNGEKTPHRVPLPAYPFESRAFPTVDANQIKDDIRTLYESGQLSPNRDKSQWYYTPSWKRSELNRAQAASSGTARVLIFMDNSGLGSDLTHRLQQQGHSVALVRPGKGFSQKVHGSAALFTLNPGDKEDYYTLFSTLRKSSRVPGIILHAWNLDAVKPSAYNMNEIEKEQVLGYHSLLFIAQAIGRNNINDPIRLRVFTANMQDVTGGDLFYPGKATVTGPVKVIPREYPNIRCSAIDLDRGQLSGRYNNIYNIYKETLLPQLLTEVTAPVTDQFVAFRNRYRWVQTFVRAPMDKPSTPPALLREGGVYLITGGLGGLGLVFAQHLAGTVKANIILTGRSAFPARDEWERYISSPTGEPGIVQKIRQLQAIEQSGGQTRVYSADTVNRDHMEEVVQRVHKEFGRIDGVFHTAGLPDGEMIQLRTMERSQNILNPKVTGTWTLTDVLRPYDVDFLVLFSSINAVTAPVGQVAYCSGNAFMDAFAHFSKQAAQERRFKKNRFPLTVSINWPRWHNTGMALIPEQLHKDITGQASAGGLSRQDGVDAFNRIMASGVPQAVVCDCDLEILQKHLDKTGVSHYIRDTENVPANNADQNVLDNGTGAQRKISTPYAPPVNDCQHRLTGIYREFFGNRQIGIDDDFFELGGDSLKAISMTHRLKKDFPTVTLNDFLALPTIRELSSVIPAVEASCAPVLHIADHHQSNEDDEEREFDPLNRLDCIERLNRGHNNRDMFIIHPMHGMVNPYRLLAESLEPKFNVYGIQARGVKPGTRVSETPGRMIDDYIEQILQVQPEGPFIFAGYCIGAFIAYEIVRRLEVRGFDVERLIIFDETAFTIDRYEKFYRVLDVLPGFVRPLMDNLNEWYFDRKVRKRNLREIDINLPAETGANGLNGEDLRKDRIRLYMHALGNSVLPLGIINTPILALLAEEPLPGSTVPDYTKMTRSRVDIVSTPGDHDSIFDSPNVERLAESIMGNIG